MIAPILVSGVLARNMERTENPLGIRNEKINRWWRDGEIKQEGEWLFFTGMLYQLNPYVDALTAYLERLENSRLQRILALSGIIPVPFSIIDSMASEKMKERCDRILRNIYIALKKSGVDVFYIPELDTYSGILLHDMGNEGAFREHARKVAERLKDAGIDKVVTADPHTTYALKVLYPELAGSEIEVKSYLELLEPFDIHSEKEFVVHDPCYYGRYLRISDRIREVLDGFGIKYRDVKYSKNLTNCCGGPVESISPSVSCRIAELRLEELGKSGILTFCPICLLNLSKGGGDVTDFAEVMVP